jgi:hypothetical protein
VNNDKVKIESFHELENLLNDGKGPLLDGQLVILLLSELGDIRVDVEFLAMVELFLLFLFYPVVDRTDFGVFLNYRAVDVMVNFCYLFIISLGF